MVSRLKQLRLAMGYSQLIVQAKTGINQAELSKMERGLRNLSVDQAKTFAIVYNTSIDYIVGLTDNPAPYPKCKDN